MNPLEIVCPSCFVTNRVPAARLTEAPNCGKCHQPLFPGSPVVVNETQFRRMTQRSGVPVVVDFWADWCGPCKAFAPTFAAAAAELEPRFRFLKLDVDASPSVSQALRIQSIPTLAVFRGGSEIARQSGAMSAAQFRHWLEPLAAA